jgi:hypothetical protein
MLPGEAPAGAGCYRYGVGEGGVEGVRERVRFVPGDLVRQPRKVQDTPQWASGSSSGKTMTGK